MPKRPVAAHTARHRAEPRKERHSRARTTPRDVTDIAVIEKVTPPPFGSNPFLWPFIVAASASSAAISYWDSIAHLMSEDQTERPVPTEPSWLTPHRIALELTTMRLRDFSTRSEGVPTLVCAPFALHGATVADFASGHSLIAALQAGGLGRLFVTDWRSATPDMRLLSIDNYLADLNVVLDDIGPPVDLIGLCQGGWMALLVAARFPTKVRKIVLAGAPIDVRAGRSTLSEITAEMPLEVFDEFVRLGDGRVIGQRMLNLWNPENSAADARRVLQLSPTIDASERVALEGRYFAWYGWTVDLPGTYYLQTVSWLFKENRIAEGKFVALGRTVRLSEVRAPMFLLGAENDELVSTGQLFATANLVGTQTRDTKTATAPCDHLGLFMGAETLTRSWPQIVDWLTGCHRVPASP